MSLATHTTYVSIGKLKMQNPEHANTTLDSFFSTCSCIKAMTRTIQCYLQSASPQQHNDIHSITAYCSEAHQNSNRKQCSRSNFHLCDSTPSTYQHAVAGQRQPLVTTNGLEDNNLTAGKGRRSFHLPLSISILYVDGR